MKKHIATLLSITALIFIDQMSKIWASAALRYQNGISIIKNVFELQYLENQGAAFGILQNRQGIFVVITLAALVLLTYVYFKMPTGKRYIPMKVCYVFLMAGAVGNFIDRVSQGFVVDFFYFRLIDFPIFNVADIYVVAAVAGLLFFILFYYKEEELDFLSRKGKYGDND